MKKFIATVLAFLSLMFCADVPSATACPNCCNHGSSCHSNSCCANSCNRCAGGYSKPASTKKEGSAIVRFVKGVGALLLGTMAFVVIDEAVSDKPTFFAKIFGPSLGFAFVHSLLHNS